MIFNLHEQRDAHVMMATIAISGELRQYYMPKSHSHVLVNVPTSMATASERGVIATSSAPKSVGFFHIVAPGDDETNNRSGEITLSSNSIQLSSFNLILKFQFNSQVSLKSTSVLFKKIAFICKQVI